VLRDAFKAADARTDHDAGGATLGLGLRLPSGILQRFIGSRDPVQDEVADLAQLLGLEERLGIERAVAAVASGNDVSDLARKIVHLKLGHDFGRASACQQLLPAMLEAHSERRYQTQACDDDT